MLSMNIISWEYIAVKCNRSFLQPLNFVPHAFVYTSFSGPSAMSTEELTMNTEQ